MNPVSRSHALEAAFLQNRARLLRFVAARGAGDAAEDIVQEVWLRLASASDPVAASQPGYMMRTADRLMIDRYRATRQAMLREHGWAQTQPGLVDDVSPAPDAGRVVEGRELARLVEEALTGIGERPAAIFRRHRIDGVPQRRIAQEFAVSLSTVESDLRRAYAVLRDVKGIIDEA